MKITDITREWPAIATDLPGLTPYHSGWWGDAVAESFRGEFKVFRIDGNPDHTGPRYVPVMIGGQLGGDGFWSGHIGYGGVLTPRIPVSSLSDHLGTLRFLETELDRPCRRLSLGPELVAGIRADRNWDAFSPDVRRSTTIVELTEDPAIQVASYAKVVRKAIRKCQRHELTAGPLEPSDIEVAVELVHQTQERVGSRFRTPPGLIAKMIEEPTDRIVSIGCWADTTLAAVGIFLRAGGAVEFALTGWRSDLAAIGPNYVVIDEGIRYCGERGDRVLDMGYSHTEGIARFKRHWGGREVSTLVLEGADLDSEMGH